MRLTKRSPAEPLAPGRSQLVVELLVIITGIIVLVKIVITIALTRRLRCLECHPVHQKFVGLIPHQDTYLGCRFDPHVGALMGGN